MGSFGDSLELASHLLGSTWLAHLFSGHRSWCFYHHRIPCDKSADPDFRVLDYAVGRWPPEPRNFNGDRTPSPHKTREFWDRFLPSNLGLLPSHSQKSLNALSLAAFPQSAHQDQRYPSTFPNYDHLSKQYLWTYTIDDVAGNKTSFSKLPWAKQAGCLSVVLNPA